MIKERGCYHFTKFLALHLLVSEIDCLRQHVLIVVLQELQTTLYNAMFSMVCSLNSMCIPSFALIYCYVSELRVHLCPYCNIWPEAVSCCFTRTTLFTKLLFV